MSDGPHRSLSMRRGWKMVAERANNLAFANEEVRDAIVGALTNDWQKEIPAGFIALILEVLWGKTLFSQDKIQGFVYLQQMISGNTMGTKFLEFLKIDLHGGKSEQAVLRDAISLTMIDQSACCARQVEEHYLRIAGMQELRRVRQRINKAIQLIDFRSLSIELLNGGPKSAYRVKRYEGVNDGVNL